MPVGRRRRKYPFSLRYIEPRTLHATFDLFGILAICFGQLNFNGPTESAYAAQGPQARLRNGASST